MLIAALPTPPRASIDPRRPGHRTFDQHTGKKPVTVDSQGDYIFAPTTYGIFAVLLLGLIALAWVLKRTNAR